MRLIAAEEIHRQLVDEFLVNASETPEVDMICSPFTYDDGDHIAFWLQERDGVLWLSDEGGTCERCESFKTRRIQSILDFHGAQYVYGDLYMAVEDRNVGQAVMTLIQVVFEVLAACGTKEREA